MARNKEFRFPVTVLIGSEISNMRKIAHNRRIDPGYRGKYYTTAAISTILTAFSKVDTMLNKRRLQLVEIKKSPVFIIAFWRSGTTLLHSLLCQNPEFAFVSTFQTVFPKLTLSNQWWLKLIATPFFPEYRPADKVKLEWMNPQEEEMALGNMQENSFYNFMYFPHEFNEYTHKGLLIDTLNQEDLQRWKENYIRIIKTAMLNTGGSRFLSKNPPNAFRIKQLLDMFPDARFIHISRKPDEVIFSFKRFMIEVIKGTALQNYSKELLEQRTKELYDLYIKKYNEDKHLIPEEHLVEIDYHAFLEDKIGDIKKIYDKLGLEGFDSSLPMMEQYLNDTKDFQPWDHRKSTVKKH